MELGDQRFYRQRYYVQEWADKSMLHITVARLNSPTFDQVNPAGQSEM